MKTAMVLLVALAGASFLALSAMASPVMNSLVAGGHETDGDDGQVDDVDDGQVEP